MVSTYWLCGGVSSEKEQWHVLPLLSGRKLLPSSCLILDNSVPPCMSLMPFNLLPACWNSEGVSPSKSVYGTFKRNCQGVQQFLFSTVLIPAGFYSQKLWGLTFLALEPWAGGPGEGLTPVIPEISLLIFICCMWVWKQPIPCLCPSNQFLCGFFYNFIVVEFPISSVSDCSE